MKGEDISAHSSLEKLQPLLTDSIYVDVAVNCKHCDVLALHTALTCLLVLKGATPLQQ